MISLNDYFGPWGDCDDATPERRQCAEIMLDKVNALLLDAEAHGVELRINPDTETLVSGGQYGGFRPQACTIGASDSAHKEGRAVDVFDPVNALDNWISDAILEHHGLYREMPLATRWWCHLSDRAPDSGRRTFQP